MPQPTMKTLNIIKNDPYLQPFEQALNARYEYAQNKEKELTGGRQSLADFASGYLYFGLHRTKTQWIFREYAPNATEIYLIGDFNNWQQGPEYQLKNIGNGVWEIKLPLKAMRHGDLYKLMMHWSSGFENESQHGQRVWCRMTLRRYSVHRCGHLPSRMSSNRKVSSRIKPPC